MSYYTMFIRNSGLFKFCFQNMLIKTMHKIKDHFNLAQIVFYDSPPIDILKQLSCSPMKLFLVLHIVIPEMVMR